MEILLIIIILQLIVLVAIIVSQSKTAKSLRELEKLLNQGTMNKEEKIKEICEQSLGKLGGALSEAIANAIIEGYKLGWEECVKQLGVKL